MTGSMATGRMGTSRRLVSAAAVIVAWCVLPNAATAQWSSVFLDGNRVLCGNDNQGNLCGSLEGPYGGGGYWPDFPNLYIFSSGLQIAGIVDTDAGFEWAGDTVGAYIFDARGTQPQGEQLTLIYPSNQPEAVASWPTAAFIRDTSLYHPSLQGQLAVSNLDSWVRYWDGNPALLSGRSHPMGIVIEQRTLQFLDPNGNDDILYFVFDVYNVTASDPAVYADLDPVVRADMAEFGRRFHDGVAEETGDEIPEGGYRIDSMYVALSADPDVGGAGANSSTIALPFDMAFAYKSDFSEPTWFFPPEINMAPLARAPGLVGFQLLRTPSDPGPGDRLALFSNTEHSSLRPPLGVSQLWRYLSGHFSRLEGDASCTVNPAATRLCLLPQEPGDTRFYQSAGPYSIAPGEKLTFVMAYVFAAPVEAPLVALGGALLPPGIPASGSEIATNPSLVRDIERVAGWAGQTDADGDGVIAANEVATVQGSLLHKAQIAQAMLDNGFLLPAPPDQPPFYLVLGDEKVTVIWQQSATEQSGDPYFRYASDPESPLFDPNFRRNDVEGYRIYRGRPGEEMQLLAQFDYDHTTLRDFTGAWDFGSTSSCAPELGPGYDAPPACPVDFSGGGRNTGDAFVDHPLRGNIPQIRLPGRVVTSYGGVIGIAGRVDSTIPADLRLQDTGVPFAFIDEEVEAGIRYVYSVTAFDVNSVNSGQTSQESLRYIRVADVTRSATNEVLPTLSTFISGDDDIELVTDRSFSIDSLGRFDGSPPPGRFGNSSLSATFGPVVQELLPEIDLAAVIDSVRIVPGIPTCSNGLGVCYELFMSYPGASRLPTSVRIPWPVWSSFGESSQLSIPAGSTTVGVDSAAAATFRVPDDIRLTRITLHGVFRQYIEFSSFEGQASRRGFGRLDANVSPGGSRWFDGPNETAPHPTLGVAVGQLAGVNRVWAPIHHTDTNPDDGVITTYPGSGQMQCFGYVGAGLGRQADVKFTWTDGTPSQVRDLTHHVDVPFVTSIQSGWGFVGDNDGDGVISWRDFDLVEGVVQIEENLGFCGVVDPGVGQGARLSRNPVVMPVSLDGELRFTAVVPGPARGFGLYVNGERYIFDIPGGTLPQNGTAWTLRSYAGIVSRDFAGFYYYNPARPSPAIPGLRFRFVVDHAAQLVANTDSLLDLIHTVPDPYYIPDETVEPARLRFVNLPDRANIRIYSTSGILVKVIDHVTRGTSGNSGEATWDMLTREGLRVASGVYFWHVETPEGLQRVGRFTIINGSGVRGLGPAR